jgi:hypothetical protein
MFVDVDRVATLPNVAAFAAHVATSLPFLAAILPLLPPRTRNDTVSWAAKWLESSVGGKGDADAKSKSGKNGNVDRSGQH